MPVLSALSNERDAFWDLLAERAALTPDRTMLVDERGRALTYGEFVELAEHVAAGMADMGVHPGQIVSWQLPTVIESALLMAALSRLKVSSNPILPILRRTEVSMIVQDLDSDWLIVPDVWRGFDYAAMAREITEGLPTQMVIVDTNGHGPGSYALALGDPATLRAWTSPGGDHPVRWYYYTSGTTGRPKGIVHTERSVMAAASYQQNVLDIDRDDVHSMPYPITHMGGPLTLTSLARVGAKTLLIETWDPLRSPLIQAEHGVTLLGSAVPFFLAYLDAQAANPDRRLFPNLRWGIAGGAPLPPEVSRRFAAELNCGGILNGYGLSECPGVLCSAPQDAEEDRHGSVGRPGPRIRIKVVRADGSSCAPGEEGELRVDGPQKCQGYLDPTMNADLFDEDGFVRTGDLATVDAKGYVRITGRLKDVIIRNAENISALEIEGVLFELSSIEAVAVIGTPHRVKGEIVCAVIVPAHGATAPTISELAEHCISLGLAKQKIPERIEIVESLPLNPMGKVIKAELRERFSTN